MAIETEGQETAPAADSNDGLSFDQIDSILNFDPFNKEEAKGAPVVEDPPAEEEETLPAEPAKAEAQTAPAQESQTAEPPPQPPEDSEKALLKQQLASMQAALDALQKPQPQQNQPRQQEEFPVPEYNYNIPEPLIQHLQSENPAEVRAGIGALMQGLSQTVHRTVVKDLTDMMQHVVPQMVRQGVDGANTAREIFTDFYGTHKDLNVPELRPLIVNTAQQVANEFRANSWTPQLRDETARRVKAVLAGHATPPAPAVTQPPATPPAKPPAQFGGNGTRTNEVPMSKTAADIKSTLFGG